MFRTFHKLSRPVNTFCTYIYRIIVPIVELVAPALFVTSIDYNYSLDCIHEVCFNVTTISYIVRDDRVKL